jgi:hypothetical protein
MRWRELFEDTDPLSRLVWRFRRQMEDDEDWVEIQSCFTGMCSTYAKDLAAFLQKHGFRDAKTVRGYYRAVEDAYLDHVDADEVPDEADWDNAWQHWWVEVGGNIVDVTADQFHPSDRDAYRVVITRKGDPSYG